MTKKRIIKEFNKLGIQVEERPNNNYYCDAPKGFIEFTLCSECYIASVDTLDCKATFQYTTYSKKELKLIYELIRWCERYAKRRRK